MGNRKGIKLNRRAFFIFLIKINIYWEDRMKKYILMFFFSFICSFVILSVDVTSHKGTGSSAEYCIENTEFNIYTHLMSLYGDKPNVEIYRGDAISGSKNVLIPSCANLKQKFLNDNYNSNDNPYEDIEGTCAIVATTNLVQFYGSRDGFPTDDEYDSFDKIYTAARKKGYTDNSGTSYSKVNNIVTSSFNLYGSSRKGNTEWWSVLNKVRKSIKNSEPVILSLPNHFVVAKGLDYYTVYYDETYRHGFLNLKKSTRTVTKTIEFLIVNEGWGYDNGSLIRSDLITDIMDSYQLTYAQE